jgi:hypothetical protein
VSTHHRRADVRSGFKVKGYEVSRCSAAYTVLFPFVRAFHNKLHKKYTTEWRSMEQILKTP